MKSITFKPIVYASFRKVDGSYPVRIRVTFDRRSRWISTNICVTSSQLTKGLKIKDASVLDSLDTIIRDLRQSSQRINFFALQEMTVDDVVKFLLQNNSQSFALDFPEFAKSVIATKGRGAKNYTSALNALSSFMQSQRYDISTITSSTMTRFEDYLVATYGRNARCVSLYTSSIAHLHQCARRQFNDEELGLVRIGNPFARYRCPAQRQGTHRNAPPAIVQIMLLMRHSLSGRERLGVDAFLISFALMGANAPDIYEMKKSRNDVIIYNRRKTRERRADNAEMRVRVESCVQSLFREYESRDDHLFSFASRYATFENFSRATNIGLSEFAKRLSLSVPLTLYVARHTWATIARSSVCNIDKSVVNDCICHVDSAMRVTDIYAEKDWRVIWNANAKVLNLFSWM